MESPTNARIVGRNTPGGDLPGRDHYGIAGCPRRHLDDRPLICRPAGSRRQSRAERRRREPDWAQNVVATLLLAVLLAATPPLVVDGMRLPVPAGTLAWMSMALPALVCVGWPVAYTVYRHLRALRVRHQPRHAAAAAPATAAPATAAPATAGSADGDPARSERPQQPTLGQRLALTMIAAASPHGTREGGPHPTA